MDPGRKRLYELAVRAGLCSKLDYHQQAIATDRWMRNPFDPVGYRLRELGYIAGGTPKRSARRLLDADIPPWKFISMEQLGRDVATMAGRLLPISGVAGVPVSGMLVAPIIASLLHVPLYEASNQYGLRAAGHGGRGDSRFVDPKDPILVIEDSVCTGGSMRKIKERLGRGNYLFASMYGNEPGLSELDFYGAKYDQPHLLEWNLGNTFYLHYIRPDGPTHGDGTVVDMDGVLCEDPPRFDESDPAQRAAYLEWITNAPMRSFVPRMFDLKAIVSYRCEYTREVTEAWLNKRRIRYQELILWPGPPESRIWDTVHKAKVFCSKNYGLFIESSEWQAKEIARLSGKPVLCWDTKTTILPESRIGALSNEGREPLVVMPKVNPKITAAVAVTALSVKKHSVERQTLCLNTWKGFGFDIVVKNTEAEIAELKPLYPQVSRWIVENETSVGFGYPTQLFKNLIDTAQQIDKPIVIINSDIELYGEASSLVDHISDNQSVLGQRWDYVGTKDYAKESLFGIDLVTITPSQAKQIPKMPLAIGGPFWDYVVPLYLKRAAVRLKFLHEPIMFHEDHPIKWRQADWDRMHDYMEREFGVSVRNDNMTFHRIADPDWKYDRWHWVPIRPIVNSRVGKCIYLDLDGVVNAHEHCHHDGVSHTNAPAVRRLNRILEQAHPDEVCIISAWRYFLRKGFMTTEGFRQMLKSHGIMIKCALSYIDEDYETPDQRADAVRRHVAWRNWAKWVAIDDMPLGLEYHVRPKANEGLQSHHVDEAVRHLS